MSGLAVVLAGISALSWGASDFAGGLASKTVPVTKVVFWSQSVGLVIVSVAAPLVGGDFVLADLGWGATAGGLGAVGLLALYRGLAVGRMSVVAPLSAVAGALVPVAVGFGLGERPSPVALAGVAVGIPALWLIVGGDEVSGPGPSGVVEGLVAGVGFGLFFVFISRSGAASGLWPLVGARAMSITVVAFLAFVAGDAAPPRSSRAVVAAAGVGDMAANIAFLFASRLGLLSLTAAVSSLYPAATVALARFVLAERLRRRQVFGLVAALAAVALIAAG